MTLIRHQMKLAARDMVGQVAAPGGGRLCVGRAMPDVAGDMNITNVESLRLLVQRMFLQNSGRSLMNRFAHFGQNDFHHFRLIGE